MKQILYISPSINVKGGISTVIKGYLNSDLSKNNRIFLVSSHVDGTKFIKSVQAIFGLMKTFVYLIFKKIDVVHIHGSDIISSSRKYFFFKLVKPFSPKVIYHFHGASFLEQYRKAPVKWREWIKYLFEKADLVICLSESWKKFIQEIAPQSDINVIPNSVKLPNLHQKRDKDDGAIRLTFLGLIGERKGVFDLLKVVKRLIDDDFKLKLHVGGNGEIERLRKTIADLTIAGEVECLGWISEKQRDKLLRETDIFVLPSYGEGMPMSILEAMSYSVPVVSTTVGGIPELVSDGETGFLIEPGDLDALYRKLKCLIQDKELRKKFGEKARQFVASRHNLKFITQQIDQIYNSL